MKSVYVVFQCLILSFLVLPNFVYADANDEYSRVLASYIEDNTLPVGSLERVVDALRNGKVINPVRESDLNDAMGPSIAFD